MKYTKEVVERYENPQNVGSLDEKSSDVGTGVVGAPSCGDVIKLQIKVNEDGVISEAKFKAFGCGAAIASSDLMTEMVIGKKIDDAAKEVSNEWIAEHLSLPPVKLHCSVLAQEAIEAATSDYMQKQKNKQNAS